MSELKRLIENGGLIAYPTEAVYGLGCDPMNESSVRRLCELKQRPLNKGLILIASNWAQLATYVNAIPEDNMAKVKRTWPGPVTWLFPASDKAPKWICGDSDKIAVRISAHPIVNQLCEESNMALVSTSCNVSQAAPCRSADCVRAQFGVQLDLIIDGDLGEESNPSQIFDALTGKQYR